VFLIYLIFSDDEEELTDNILNHENEKNKETLHNKLDFINNELSTLNNDYDKTYSDETFNNTRWDDTYEITTRTQIASTGIK
jgi:predicted nuclease with TOPRIM domain